VDDAMHRDPRGSRGRHSSRGRVALLRASEVLKKIRTQNDDRRPGRRSSASAFQPGSLRSRPMRGRTAPHRRQDPREGQYAYGFDAQNGEYVNMVSKASSTRPRSCARRWQERSLGRGL